MGLFSKLFGRGSSDDGKSGNDAVTALIAKLDDADPKLRCEAVIALGELGGQAKAAVEKIEDLINDPDGDVCNAAANAYSQIVRGF